MILLTAFIIYTSATIAVFTLSYLDLRKKRKNVG
jgi:Flp pilus assembly protein protease CpaA